MADERGHGFREPLRLVGPFPSGAPAIFIDQVAKLGQACGIIGCVGDDDFGRVNLDRLSHDGVDIKAVEVHPAYVTGSAFVRYRDDGNRDFVFNIKNSATPKLPMSVSCRPGNMRSIRPSNDNASTTTPITLRSVERTPTSYGQAIRTGWISSWNGRVSSAA